MNRADTLREACFDPLFAGPTISRRLLDAMSRPGAVLSLGALSLMVPPPELRPACAVLLAVLDRDVTFHVTDPDALEMRDYLRFNTGACITGPEHADFVRFGRRLGRGDPTHHALAPGPMTGSA